MNVFPKRISSAAVIIENEAHELLVVKANYKKYWTLPGGMIDHDETPKQAAIREVAEEVGIVLDAKSVEFVAVVDRMSSTAQTYQFIFKAAVPIAGLESIILQASEIDEYAFVSKDQIARQDRLYARAVEMWAKDISGYVEQQFGKKG
jgi:ADP-ribose pyrophosphatase YjhB (NUDIX family)